MTTSSTTRRSSELPSEYWYDKHAAERPINFFSRHLKHIKGELAGKPFIPSDSQSYHLRQIFGWKRKDGTRRYRTVYWEEPRKNGKTTLAAGVALYVLCADGEPGAEVYSAAADREQANLCFGLAKAMVSSSSALAKRTKVHKYAITYPATFGSYKVLSADAFTKHGLNAHGIVFDELHAQPDRELWDVLTTSTGARRQPLVFAITTAGYDRHSICYEIHTYAKKVQAGIIKDDSFYPVIYAADESDDWTKEETWRKANPGYGVTVKADYFQTEVAKAKELPRYQNTFRQLHLNQWTEQAVRWLPMEAWDAGALKSCGELETQLTGSPCYCGLDLASTTDLSVLAMVFPQDAGRIAVLCRFWIPQETARAREKRDKVPYLQWIKEGWITATEGNRADYDQIRADINALRDKYDIREIAFDRWNANQISTQLAGDGFRLVDFGQGFRSMNEPSKHLEALLAERKVDHGGNPVLRWNASNVAVSKDAAGNIKPDKAKSTERIDGIVAMVMGIGRMIVQGQNTDLDIRVI